MYQDSSSRPFDRSEGTLGVITSANLKLILARKTLAGMFAFKSEAAALEAVVGLFKVGVSPSILEFLDRQSVSCAEIHRQSDFQPARSSILLVELDGLKSASSVRPLDYMTGLAASHREARTEAQAENYGGPPTCSQSMFSLADTKLNEGIVVPLNKQVALIRYQ